MDANRETPAFNYPYLTAELPGVGGAIKTFDEDFVVEEIPLYEASGEGTHVYFTIEKRGLTTPAAIQRIARALGKKPADVGYAGLKDAHGITRQRFSIEHIDPNTIEAINLDRITILNTARHTNKLKRGHLAGNRFVIKIRETSPAPLAAAQQVLNVLTARGMPNYFGPQRFGARGDNAAIGRHVLMGEFDEAVRLLLGRPGPSDRQDVAQARKLFDEGNYEESLNAWPGQFNDQRRVLRAFIQSDQDAARAWRAVDHSLRKLLLSSVQSELFNRVVAQRLSQIDRLATGDLAYKHRNGACFVVEDASIEQPRCDALEISPSGPLFGRKMTKPQGEPARIETTVLEESGLQQKHFVPTGGVKLDGARRPLRVAVEDPTICEGDDDHGPHLSLTFTLPSGCYATCLTREICKTDRGRPQRAI